MPTHGDLAVIGPGNDLRPAESRIVEGIDGEVVGKGGNHSLEKVELSAHRVHQNQRRAASNLQVPDFRLARTER